MGLVLLTALLVVGSGEAKTVMGGKAPTLHPLLSGFIVGLFLQIFMSVNASLTTKFCYLVMIGAVLYNGASLINAINTSNKPSTTAQTKSLTAAQKANKRYLT